MELRGHVENGKVVLDEPVLLPNGTEVTIHTAKKTKDTRKSSKKPPTLASRLQAFIGKAKHLPPDASVNLDHYLNGLLKRN